MSNMKLSVKLIGSFVIVAVMTLVVGFVGWRGVNGLSDHLVEVGDVRLPSIQNLLVIQRAAESVLVAQRTLLNPELSKEERTRQFTQVRQVREAYEKAWKIYEPLPQTPEEAALWQKFVPAWAAWRKENNAFFKIVEEMGALDLGNPMDLRRTIQEIRGDHYKVMSQVSMMIGNGVFFEGGEDHTACGLGQWAASVQTQNPTIRAAVSQIVEPHKLFHAAVARIKANMKNGEMST
ncbi:MAG TPA: MCP four helix bundle domain-containing protein, partial [Desulfosarcina sp.]|nr:MCP four helix bundle domain-containing protein [Desulfosarcina sp.]